MNLRVIDGRRLHCLREYTIREKELELLKRGIAELASAATRDEDEIILELITKVDLKSLLKPEEALMKEVRERIKRELDQTEASSSREVTEELREVSAKSVWTRTKEVVVFVVATDAKSVTTFSIPEGAEVVVQFEEGRAKTANLNFSQKG